jgi:hypothetical protein
VNDLVPVTTHIYEEHTLSTDQVISLFDGGYRFGLMEQLDLMKQESEQFNYKMFVLKEEFQRFFYEHDIDFEVSKEYTSKFESLFNEFESKIESNLIKKFDVCQYSNEERVRDERVKERNKEFLGQLLNSFKNIT